MLTPTQIRDYRFQSAGRGLYKSDEVDEIYSKVIDSYEQMFRENSELIKRVGMLAEKVEEYRRDEELIQKTLLVAQRKADEIEDESKQAADDRIAKAESRALDLESMAERQSAKKIEDAQARSDRIRSEADERASQIIGQAERKANEIITDSTHEAKELLKRIKTDIAENGKALEDVKRKNNELKAQLKNACEDQLRVVSELPDFDIEDSEKAYELDDTYENELENLVQKYMTGDEKTRQSVTFVSQESKMQEQEKSLDEFDAPAADKLEYSASSGANGSQENVQNEAAPVKTKEEPAESPSRGGFKVYMESLMSDEDDDFSFPSTDKSGSNGFGNAKK